jgi:peptide/nickel transport system substrate-binding protein
MKTKISIAILLMLTLVLTACGAKPAVSEPTPAAGDQGGGAPAAALDPALAGDASLREASALVYEGLVTMQDGRVTAGLALDVTASADTLDYIFVLRPGVTFHDGTPLDADAVMANFSRWFDPQDPRRGSGSYEAWAASFGGFKGETAADGSPKSNFDGIEKVDDLSVLVHLNGQDPDFLIKLTDPAFAIVSPAFLDAGRSTADGGTGPYVIGAWDDSGLTLKPFSGYWDPALVPAGDMQIDLGG